MFGSEYDDNQYDFFNFYDKENKKCRSCSGNHNKVNNNFEHDSGCINLRNYIKKLEELQEIKKQQEKKQKVK